MLGEYKTGIQVRRAWRTDPKFQFEVGTITALVNDGTLTSPDVEVIWADGSKTTELGCELIEVEANNGVWTKDIYSETDQWLMSKRVKYYHDV